MGEGGTEAAERAGEEAGGWMVGGWEEEEIEVEAGEGIRVGVGRLRCKGAGEGG